MGASHYNRFLAMTAMHFVAMYFLMYSMVNVTDNVHHNLNQVYMAGVMTASMVLIELLLMGRHRFVTPRSGSCAAESLPVSSRRSSRCGRCFGRAPDETTICQLIPAVVLAQSVGAQTDYYNTDSGRPLTVEDAYPTERYAFELQLAPVRVERSRAGIYTWSVEPELAYGILPRTHVDSLAPGRGYGTVKGIATRSLTWARFHLNGAYTFGWPCAHPPCAWRRRAGERAADSDGDRDTWWADLGYRPEHDRTAGPLLDVRGSRRRCPRGNRGAPVTAHSPGGRRRSASEMSAQAAPD